MPRPDEAERQLLGVQTVGLFEVENGHLHDGNIFHVTTHASNTTVHVHGAGICTCFKMACGTVANAYQQHAMEVGMSVMSSQRD